MDHNHNNHNNHDDAGINSKIFGKPFWQTIFCVCFGYKLEPSPDDKNNFRTWLTLIGEVLPCRYCRDNYKKHLLDPKLALTDQIMSSRHTLTRWAYDLREAVNKALGVDYGVTYEDFTKKYESYRARCQDMPDGSCVVTEEARATAFQNAGKCDSPIIPYETALKFKDYAKARNLDTKYYEFLETFKTIDCTGKLWEQRNEICNERIKFMRENGITAIEKEGRYKGMPTLSELKLIMLRCSSLSQTEIDTIKL